MTRLIDADALREKVMQKYDYVEEYLEDIDSQPTAYDVEKVVEELKDSLYDTNTYSACDDIETIVKRGGIDD